MRNRGVFLLAAVLAVCILKGCVKYSCFMGAYQDYHVLVGDTLVKIQDYNPKNKKIYNVGEDISLKFENDTLYAL